MANFDTLEIVGKSFSLKKPSTNTLGTYVAEGCRGMYAKNSKAYILFAA